jgi:predicted ABC-class ATPase
MRIAHELQHTLQRIDGSGYKAYKDIKGEYDFGEFVLLIDYVQGDPFASPSRFRAKVQQSQAGFPEDTYISPSRRKAACDFITRRFFDAAGRFAKGVHASGKSGSISIDRPLQEVLDKTSCFIDQSCVETRFTVGLPAFGRRVAGKLAERMLFEQLPKIVRYSMRYENLDGRKLNEHIKTVEDADFLRGRLGEMGLVAFVANGAVLPRKSGVDPRPLSEGRVVAFSSPKSLRVAVLLPNRGKITGMGIPKGVTLIVGGGYHGKSTLLEALELGIYDHIPGDGRELVVSDFSTVKIRAEDSRRVEKVDISAFVSNLPFGRDTKSFSTDDASGSTSQAANIMEAMESGAKTLVIDEDTSATNFMIRDHRMQELVAKEKEPITPYIDRVRQLSHDHGVSTVLAIGGSGDYFDVADLVICMEEYIPVDVTRNAKRIAEKYKAERAREGGEAFGSVTERVPIAGSFDPSRGKREVRISSKGLHSIVFGTHLIDLGAIEQLVHLSQTRTIGDAIHYATRYMDGKRTLRVILDLVAKDIETKGLNCVGSRFTGDYAQFRPLDLACAINRLRTLAVRQR